MVDVLKLFEQLLGVVRQCVVYVASGQKELVRRVFGFDNQGAALQNECDFKPACEDCDRFLFVCLHTF